MKNSILTSIIVLFSFYGNSQIVATVELKEPVSGMCGDELYSLFDGWKQQKQASCDLSDEELIELMNEKIEYLKNNPKAKGKGVMSIYINCEGKKIQVSSGIQNNSELANEIEQFLLEYGNWTPGEFYGKTVDCSELIAVKIKKGVIYLDY